MNINKPKEYFIVDRFAQLPADECFLTPVNIFKINKTNYADLHSLSLALAYDFTKVVKKTCFIKCENIYYEVVNLSNIVDILHEAPSSAFRAKKFYQRLSVEGLMHSVNQETGIFTHPESGKQYQCLWINNTWYLPTSLLSDLMGISEQELLNLLEDFKGMVGR
jgi:hypothetical protein